MAQVTFREANRRYRRVFVPVMILYAGLCFGAPFAADALGGGRAVYAVVGVLNAAPIGVVFWLMWRYLRETDEFTRARQMAALAAGGMIVAFCATLWGFLELYRVLPSLWAFSWGVLFFAVYGLVSFWRAARERSAA